MKRSFIIVVVLIFLCGLCMSQAPGQNEQPDKIEEGKKILKKWITARGGQDRLSKIKQIQSTCIANIFPGNLNLTVDMFVKGSDKIRLDLKIPNLAITQVVNRGNGWATDMDGNVIDMPEETYREFSLRAEANEVLLNPEQYNHVFTYEGREASDNKEYILLKETGKDGLVTTHYIDPDTFLRRKYITMRNDDTSEVIESDYRDVEGIKVPFSTKIIRNGAEYVTTWVTEYKYNPDMDDSLFDRPEPEKIGFAENRIWQ
jgi:hypothetical protein